MPVDVSSSRRSDKANIFLGLIEYELNSLLGALHLVDYISVHIRFDLERYLLIMNPSRYPICMGQFLHFSHHNGLMHHVEKILLQYSHIVSSTNFGRSFVPCKSI